LDPSTFDSFVLRFRLLNLAFIRNHGSHFEAHKTAFEEGAARDDDAIIEEVYLNDLSDSKQLKLEKM